MTSVERPVRPADRVRWLRKRMVDKRLVCVACGSVLRPQASDTYLPQPPHTQATEEALRLTPAGQDWFPLYRRLLRVFEQPGVWALSADGHVGGMSGKSAMVHGTCPMCRHQQAWFVPMASRWERVWNLFRPMRVG